MYRVSDFSKNSYRVHEVAEILGVTTKTIRNYDKDGKLKTCRTEGNHRMIMRDDLIGFLMEKGLIVDDTANQKKDVIYARVSTNAQKQGGDLDRQALFLAENVSGLMNPVILKEVGSELNDKRAQLQKLLKMVCNDEVRNVYVTSEDRLAKFGYHYLETMFQAHNVNIITIEGSGAEKALQEESAEDITAKADRLDKLLSDLENRKDTDMISCAELKQRLQS